MAYCEIVTKIGNATEPPKYEQPQLYQNNQSNLTQLIVSGIIESVVDKACYYAEEKTNNNINKTGENSRTCHKNYSGDIQENIIKNQNEKTSEMSANCDVVLKKESVESSKIGLGDGLIDGQPVRTALSSVEITTEKLPPVEKKSRLTDLVKNSKQVLSKLILNESLKNNATSDKWEEKDEELVKSVDLDNEIPYKAAANIINKNTSQKNELEIMEVVDLTTTTTTNSTNISNKEVKKLDEGEEVIQTNSSTNTTTANTSTKKTNTFPIGASSSKTLRSRFSTMKVTSKEFASRKKWNFGSKVWSYLKKRNSATKNKDKQQSSPSDNNNITPQ